MQWHRMTTRVRGNVVMVDIEENVCLCDEEELPALIRHLLDLGHLRLVLNLSALPHVDSAGLGGMVRAYVAVTRRGGQLGLVHVQARVRELLEVTRLVSMFPVFGLEGDALRAFGEILPVTAVVEGRADRLSGKGVDSSSS